MRFARGGQNKEYQKPEKYCRRKQEREEKKRENEENDSETRQGCRKREKS